MITIELIYALPDQQNLITLEVESACTVEQAIRASGLLVQYPEIDLAQNKVGIFSQVCQLDCVLSEGDRIEIYRPLLIDPKASRMQKAKQQKKAEARKLEAKRLEKKRRTN
jgi:uncharacterized protein